MLTKEEAALQICRTLELTAQDTHPDNGELRSCNDEQWTLVNARCRPSELPEELQGWAESSMLPTAFIPKCIMAMYALGREIPAKEVLFPED